MGELHQKLTPAAKMYTFVHLAGDSGLLRMLSSWKPLGPHFLAHKVQSPPNLVLTALPYSNCQILVNRIKMQLKQLTIPIFLLLTVCSIKAQSRLDSVRVYCVPFDLLNKTPLSTERVKTFPIATSYVIVDSTKLSQIVMGIKSLQKADVKFQVLDERMVCDLYTGRKKKGTLVINQVKYVRYGKKMYVPSDSLISSLSQ